MSCSLAQSPVKQATRERADAGNRSGVPVPIYEAGLYGTVYHSRTFLATVSYPLHLKLCCS